MGRLEEVERELKECKETLSNTQQQLELLLDNIPGGIMIYDAETGKIDYIGEGCLRLFHCTEEQFREHFYNSFNLFVMREDRAMVKEQIQNQSEFFDTVELTYRVRGLLDDVIWIYHKSRKFMSKDGRPQFFVVINDVTNEKLIHAQLQHNTEQLYIESERFRLLEEATDNVEYDYDVLLDTMESSEMDDDGNRIIIRNFLGGDYMKKMLHPKDYPLALDKFRKALKEPTKGNAEYRVISNDEDGGGFNWFRISYASFADKNGHVIRFVGSAKDISAEKAEQEELRAKVDIDSMTGLLNKEAIQRAIENYLQKSEYSDCHAIMMIDTDHFKAINDTFGHDYGDEVIKFTGRSIRDIFRESDFVGRMGGDEFMVFMKHTTPRITELRATQLNDALRHTFAENGISVQISCSIGIAYFARDGEDYSTLFRHADEALYQVKENGRDGYCVYREDI
ncbi:diguanylate cyclase (GGDEF) domain-containing protein [Lachnospiraceae bacterium]|nr:diguanylate cyclase (GGDEF) domain-containing protein [Lachnospiraceae bacterium]